MATSLLIQVVNFRLVQMLTKFGVTDSCGAHEKFHWFLHLRMITQQLDVLKGTGTHVADSSYKEDGSAAQT